MLLVVRSAASSFACPAALEWPTPIKMQWKVSESCNTVVSAVQCNSAGLSVGVLGMSRRIGPADKFLRLAKVMHAVRASMLMRCQQRHADPPIPTCRLKAT